MRKDCALSKLTEEQKADLFDWLSTDTYQSVLKRIAEPPPAGFGIKTHCNSLFRFYEQCQASLRACDLARISAASGEGEPVSGSTPPSVLGPQSFFTAAHAAHAHATYVLAHSPLSPATFRAVSRALQQHDDTAFKNEYLNIARQQLALGHERLKLDRAQFEYNAARAALIILPELIAIDQRTDIDDEAKIWRVRDRLFGPGPGSAPASGATAGASPAAPTINTVVASASSAVQTNLK